jgi:microcystin-dependent protein
MPKHKHIGHTDAGGNHNHAMRVHTHHLYGTTSWTPAANYFLIDMFVPDNTHGKTGNTWDGGNHTHTFDTQTVGADEAHENMPPYCTVYYVIKIAN